ncbi:hypothetical protein K458DRAFT_381398 [Lentithecium fluviatile CBS 122367]|uniref:Uncharacterized protein n=1 Tax=Lentithecium fluviatile CBS 122367 TaxID=1168545 RepID=A0A6G1JN22_9PLEO|nr:hypothetical protein K458DRAFT_381398 [Lentithecium fluviatile CBS 122367]
MAIVIFETATMSSVWRLEILLGAARWRLVEMSGWGLVFLVFAGRQAVCLAPSPCTPSTTAEDGTRGHRYVRGGAVDHAARLLLVFLAELQTSADLGMLACCIVVERKGHARPSNAGKQAAGPSPRWIMQTLSHGCPLTMLTASSSILDSTKRTAS